MISIDDQMPQAREFCEDFFGKFVDFIVEDVKNVRDRIPDDCYVCVIFDHQPMNFAHVVLKIIERYIKHFSCLVVMNLILME